MKSVQFDAHGVPEQVLQLREAPQPQPQRGEVLVRMIASPINPSDLLYIAGQYGLKPQAFPCTPGFEGVGTVEASGGGLLGAFRKGKRVAVLNDRHGNWAEYAVTTARQVIPIPADVPDEQAASFFVNPMTAYILVHEVLKVPAGAWLLQSAAGGELGKMVIRLGKQLGIRTLNVVRRQEQVEELKAIGADAVIVESAGSLAEQVRKIVGEDEVKYALDPVGGSTGTSLLQALSNSGRLISYGLLSGEPISVDPRALISGSKTVQGFWLAEWMKSQSTLHILFTIRKVRQLLQAGTFRTQIAATYPLERIREAVAHAARDGKGGKVLLKMT